MEINPDKPNEGTLPQPAQPISGQAPSPAGQPTPAQPTPEYSAKAVPPVQTIKPIDSQNMPHIVHHESQETEAANPSPGGVKPKKSFPFKKILLIVVALILIAACGAAVYYFFFHQTNQTSPVTTVVPTQKPHRPSPTQIPTKTPDATASWPIYINTKIGFSVKYPPRYQTIEIQGSGASPSGKEDNTSIELTGPGIDGFHSMFLQMLPFTGTVDNLVIQNKAPVGVTPDSCLPKIQLQSLNVGGNPARWYVTSSDAYPSCENKIYFTGENHGFYFVTGADMDKTEIQQVLSTFKFTTQQTSSPSATPN